MNHDIKTPLLRRLVTYHGYLGMQLHPVKLNQWTSLVRLFWNIALILMAIYMIRRDDPFNLVESWRRMHLDKPLLHVLIEIDIVNYQIAFLVISAVIIINGHRIVLLLDSGPFYEFYASRPHSGRIFVWYMLICNGLFCVLHLYIPLSYLLSRLGILRFLTLYCISFTFYSPVITLHYALYAINRSMKKLLDSFQLQTSDIESVANQLRTYAQASAQLTQLMSLMFLQWLTAMCIDFVVCMCLLQPEKVFGVMVYFLIAWIYVGYLVYLNQQTLHMLKQLCLMSPPKKSSAALFQLKPVLMSQKQAESQSDTIALIELYPTYRDQLQLRLFFLCKVDYVFMFHVALLMLNYGVLIMQTKQ